MEYNLHSANRPFEPAMPEYIDLAYFSFVALGATIVRLIVIRYNIPIPFMGFLIIFGMIWGIAAHYSYVVHLLSYVITTNPLDFMFAYLPVVTFYNSFCLDSIVFLKSLPQILVIGVFVSLSTCGIFGVMMKLAVDSEWDIRGALIFGFFYMPICPASIVYLLKRQSTKTRQIAVLLEGEALLGLAITDMAQTLLLNNLLGFVVQWYQFIAILARFLIGEIIVGFLFGLISKYAIRKVYTNAMTIFAFTICIPIFVYVLSYLYFSGCGLLSVSIVGLMMNMERASLSREINNMLLDVWEVLALVLDVIVCSNCVILAMVNYIPHAKLGDYILSLVAYLLYYSVRFISFLLFSPIISRLGYGMDLKSMIICVWCGIKSPYSLLIVQVFVFLAIGAKITFSCYFHAMGLFFLSTMINGTFTRMIMDFLGMRSISLTRQLNMNTCIQHMFKKRDQTISILKLDKLLADANWVSVLQSTTIKHPYKVELQMDSDDMFLSRHLVQCPDCKNEIKRELTEKELKEMTRETKIRILKTKKTFYSRQFENGMVSSEGIRILMQAIELAMDSEKAVIELDGLQKKFTKENFINRRIRMRVQEMKKNKVESVRPPRKYLRRICFKIIMNSTVRKVTFLVVLLHLTQMVFNTIYQSAFLTTTYIERRIWIDYFLLLSDIAFFCIYIVKFAIKILAYSWLRICEHGFRTYFKSVWNWIDFIVMIATFMKMLQDSNVGDDQEELFSLPMQKMIECVLYVRVLTLFRLIEIFFPKFLKYLDKNFDLKMTLTFELGKNYVDGETHILELLPYIVDNKTIQEEIKKKIDQDRSMVLKLLAAVQKDKPLVAITVKTKQVIRTVLKSMNDSVVQLKISGWMDDFEQDKIQATMEELYKNINTIKMVKPSPPKIIFKEVGWMVDGQVVDFLFENVTVKKFEPGDVVYKEGIVADGIYIVVTGLFTISYTPNKYIIQSLNEYGQIPIVDYILGGKYDEKCMDHIVSGNCIGELSILTKRAYNCIITAETHSQVYVLSNNVLHRAMELNPDPVTGLESRIWKEVGVRIALPVLVAVPVYQNFSQDQIKYTLERSFVPNLSNFKIFTVSEMIQDIILIEGVVADFNTRESFVAPTWIPRTVQKLILPASSLMNIPIRIDTKLLIIPEKDLDEYDVMLNAEETCELVAKGTSSKCLQHAAQDKLKKRRQKVKESKMRYDSQPKLDDPTSFATFKEVDEGSIYFKSGMNESNSYDYVHDFSKEEDEEEEKASLNYN